MQHGRAIRIAVPAAIAAALTLPGPAQAAFISASVSGTTATLTADDAADTLTLTDAGGVLSHGITGGSFDSATDFDTTTAGTQPVAADSTFEVVVNTAGGDDQVTITTPLVARVVADLGAGDDVFAGSVTTAGQTPDVIAGGAGDDRIAGGRGNDTMSGGDGNDTLVWNNGDGSDAIDGQGGGGDSTEVNGAQTAGDAFTIGAEAGNVRFDRTNLVPFTLTIAPTTERLEVNGLGGNDSVTSTAGIAALGASLALNGGTGDDTLAGADSADQIQGGDDADTLSGGGGDDRIAGNRGEDAMSGGDGDDVTVWNNGDGNDRTDGDAGFDVQEVNGATGAGDAFSVRPDGQRTRFERTNLVPFVIDTSNEALDLNTLGGDDTATIADNTPLVADVDGGSGNDVLTGSAGTETLRGGSGNDTLTGGGGLDAIDGDAGDDAVAARDGAPDLVRCGAGTDSATADAATVDAVADCEAVARPAAAATAAAVRIRSKRTRIRKGRAALSLACPAGATTCRGRLTLYTRRVVRLGSVRAVVRLGSASYRIAAGKRRTVRVKLARGTRALARGRRTLALRAVAATRAGSGTLASTRRVTLRVR